VADYARLVAAEPRGDLAAALRATDISRTVWMRVKRVWKRRIAEDAELAARVEADIAALRRA
jgi:hypothetical protein